MIKSVYAIKDELTGYQDPMFFRNDEEATRMFTILVNTKGSLMNESPLDYSMWKIGGYDTEMGDIFTPTHADICLIARAKDVLKKEER